MEQINRLKDPDGVELSKSIRGIDKRHSAATNRYLYYPDHLVRMPGPGTGGFLSNLFSGLYTLFTERVFSGVFTGALKEPLVATRSSSLRDESVGSFVSRRYGPAAADNLLSALFHGIYAGDIYNLSARTLLPKLWHLETRDSDSRGIMMELMELSFRQQALLAFNNVRFMNRFIKDDRGVEGKWNFLTMQMMQTSVYSFINGIGQITDALLANLRNHTNVTFETGAKIDQMSYNGEKQKFKIGAGGRALNSKDFDYTICTLSPHALSRMLQTSPDEANTSKDSIAIPASLTNALAHGPKAVNVMVVNLYYKSPDLPIPSGFGYLIPRSVPASENPERALGVIFSSETAGPRGPEAFQTIQVPDPAIQKKLQDRMQKGFGKIVKDLESEGRLPQGNTRVRVTAEEDFQEDLKRLHQELEESMHDERIQVGQDTASGTKLAVMLGGHWWADWADSDLPSEDEGIEMAKNVIKRHLKIDEEPMLAKARLQRDCIPQYQVGYRDDMARIHKELVNTFGGRLKVTGTWWQGGVGFNDCVKNARETSRRVREEWDEQTGLEDYTESEKWVIADRKSKVMVMDPLQGR